MKTALLLTLLLASPMALHARSSAEILEAAAASDWRTPDSANLLYVELDTGTIIFELAPSFAPGHVANIAALIEAGFYGHSTVVRSQDNYVAQWANVAEPAPSMGKAKPSLPLEASVDRAGLAITPIQSRDPYAEAVGFIGAFPVAMSGDRAWLAHCYGALGVARGNEASSGSGDSLYVVTGHAPRHLDRNGTIVGRALVGMSHLSTLPRGTGPLGFYEKPAEEAAPIRSILLGTAIDPGKAVKLRVLRTDTALFQEYVAARATRTEAWFAHPTNAIGLCNIPVPVEVIEGE